MTFDTPRDAPRAPILLRYTTLLPFTTLLPIVIAGVLTGCGPSELPNGAPSRSASPGAGRHAATNTSPRANAARTSGNVYMIGPSVLNHEMPAMLDQIAQSFGIDHRYDLQVKNGTALQGQWNASPIGEGRMGRAADARSALANGAFDTVVLTDLPGIDVDTQWNCTFAYALEFYNLSVRANPDVQVYFYETWVETYRPDWINQVFALRDTYQQWVFDLVQQPPGAPLVRDPSQAGECPHPNPPASREPGRDMLMIPVGRAVATLAQEIEAGAVPGVGSIDQIIPDGLHMSDLGNYFVALVFYATIYGSDPAGAPNALIDEWGRAFNAPDPAMAARFQQIAWDIVRSDPLSGVQ